MKNKHRSEYMFGLELRSIFDYHIPWEAIYLLITMQYFISGLLTSVAIAANIHDYTFTELVNIENYLIIPLFIHIIFMIVSFFNFAMKKISNFVTMLITILIFASHSLVLVILEHDLGDDLLINDVVKYSIVFSGIYLVIYTFKFFYLKHYNKVYGIITD